MPDSNIRHFLLSTKKGDQKWQTMIEQYLSEQQDTQEPAITTPNCSGGATDSNVKNHHNSILNWWFNNHNLRLLEKQPDRRSNKWH